MMSLSGICYPFSERVKKGETVATDVYLVVYDFPSSSPQESASSSELLRFDEERSKKSQGLRYNGAEKEVVCLS
jgi:hypothetical protein